MLAATVKFKNHPCFKKHWSGMDRTLPISVIIGRNNTGKSHFLEYIKTLCTKKMGEIEWDVSVTLPLKKDDLIQIFRQDTSGGVLGGNHWEDHGRIFIGKTAQWTKERGKSDELLFKEGTFYRDGRPPQVAENRSQHLLGAFPSATHSLFGKKFRHLFADRDIQPEPSSNRLELSASGGGATNIIRRFLNSSDQKYPRQLVQQDMLRALNEIFGEDGKFREITVQHHDGEDPSKVEDRWEIYLEQEHKGLVSLSSSGSGLKTVFLVLLNLLVVPRIEAKEVRDYVFAFEEVENNLHPALIRRLLKFVKEVTDTGPGGGLSIKSHPQIFLTTHSSVALDYFAGDELAQVIHVSHDGESAKTRNIDHSSKLLDVIWDLGTRPSDLLQANGIIWVEGPSDRLYLNRWIELFGDGRFREGRHYQCAFYGGGLLSNLEATHDEDSDEELINLLKINPNTVVISDSDRDKKGAHLKDRVRRIRDEFRELRNERTMHWILEGREIENYLPKEVLELAFPKLNKSLEAPGQYESFFPRDRTAGYIGKTLDRKTMDKNKLAAITTPHMKLEFLENRFDLNDSMKRIIQILEVWNR